VELAGHLVLRRAQPSAERGHWAEQPAESEQRRCEGSPSEEAQRQAQAAHQEAEAVQEEELGRLRGELAGQREAHQAALQEATQQHEAVLAARQEARDLQQEEVDRLRGELARQLEELAGQREQLATLTERCKNAFDLNELFRTENVKIQREKDELQQKNDDLFQQLLLLASKVGSAVASADVQASNVAVCSNDFSGDAHDKQGFSDSAQENGSPAKQHKPGHRQRKRKAKFWGSVPRTPSSETHQS